MEPIDQVTADGEKVVREGKSSGGEGSAATSVEVFTFAAGGVAPKKIRYTGLGNRREKNGRGIFADRESIYYSSAITDMEDDSDSTEFELDPDASETVALCHGTPREGTGAGRA
ncbi:unnamed protein product [Ectocarpus sp. 6 AP-2014]